MESQYGQILPFMMAISLSENVEYVIFLDMRGLKILCMLYSLRIIFVELFKHLFSLPPGEVFSMGLINVCMATNAKTLKIFLSVVRFNSVFMMCMKIENF